MASTTIIGLVKRVETHLNVKVEVRKLNFIGYRNILLGIASQLCLGVT